MICKLCGYEYDFYHRAICRQCPKCYHRYKKFCENLPEGWKKLMGDTSVPPAFEEWQEEQFIKKQLFDDEITEEQAKQKTASFAEKIRKRYNPTPQELEERRARIAEQEARREKTFFDTPSLF